VSVVLRWDDLTREELRDVAAEVLLVVPVGATEQHGPHLVTGTDALIAATVAERAAVAARSPETILLAPTLAYGASDHHLPFGGTLSLSVETFGLVVRDLLSSAAAAGVRRAFVLNSHGGNKASCAVAVAEAARERGIVAATALISDLVDPTAIEGAVAGHAGSFETSLMLAIAPDRVRPALRRPSPGGAARRRARGLTVGEPGRWEALDGFTDRPDEASPERGALRCRGRGRVRRGREPDVTDRSLRIAAVETTTVSAQAKTGLRVRGQRVVHEASTFTLVRVLTDEGVEGYGEVSATAAWSGEDATTATHFIRTLLGPMLVGARLDAISEHATEFDRVLRGNWFTKAGITTALWDALGRVRGVSVAELLGGPFRTEVPVKISISGDGDELRESYETATGLGFRSLKVKVGRDPSADLTRVRLARELAGSDLSLGVDANGGWPLAVALDTVPQLADFGVEFVEQPVAADDLEGLREVRALGIPVVADEAVYTPADVARIGALGAADVVSIYVGKSSGLERAVRSSEVAAASGMSTVIGANGEMGLGAAAQLHLACACRSLGSIAHGITGHHFYVDDPTLDRPLDIDGVVARLPHGPGLGVELSHDAKRGFS